MIVILYAGEESPYTYPWIPVSMLFLYVIIYRCVFLAA